MCKAGWKIGCSPRSGRERRSIKALINKGAMEACGQITDAGRKAWKKALDRLEPK